MLSKFLLTRFTDFVPLTLIAIFLFFYYWRTSFHFYLGLFTFFLGFLIWFLGLIHIGSVFHVSPYAKRLVKTGIYSKISHPIYLGSVLFFLGLCISTFNYWIWLLTLVLILIQAYRAKKEEKELKLKFGKEYLEYKRKTWI